MMMMMMILIIMMDTSTHPFGIMVLLVVVAVAVAGEVGVPLASNLPLAMEEMIRAYRIEDGVTTIMPQDNLQNSMLITEAIYIIMAMVPVIELKCVPHHFGILKSPKGPVAASWEKNVRKTKMRLFVLVSMIQLFDHIPVTLYHASSGRHSIKV
jgi:hypothetical protein